MAIEFLGGFESSYQPAHDVDVAETTGHIARWRQDLELLRSCGVDRLRYPVRWHRIEAEPKTFDWDQTDEMLGHLRDTGMRPIVDLCHHTSYPRWLDQGFVDPQFGPAYLRFLEAFATRYPWIEEYTLFNEPFTTFFLCGHMTIWPPFLRGMEGFLTMARSVLPVIAEASRAYRQLLPAGRHVYVDTCERHSAATPTADRFTAMVNDRRFLLLDLLVGRPLSPGRPFVAEVLAAGGEDLLDMEPGSVDVLGLDYYAHCQWLYLDDTGRGVMTSPTPSPLSSLILEYWDRYQLPCILGETNIRGFASDRATWLKYTLEQCELAADAGVPLEGYCWFPFIDSCDWDSLLSRASGNVDPVGVFWLDERLERRPSSMSASYLLAAQGTPAAELPAYRLQAPVAGWLQGWLPQMRHWDWQDPPADEIVANPPNYDDQIELRITEAGP